MPTSRQLSRARFAPRLIVPPEQETVRADPRLALECELAALRDELRATVARGQELHQAILERKSRAALLQPAEVERFQPAAPEIHPGAPEVQPAAAETQPAASEPLQPAEPEPVQLAEPESLREPEPVQLAEPESLQEPEPAPAPRAPLLVPVLAFRQELVLRVIVLIGVAAAFWFWTWWLAEGHGSWSAPSVIVTLLFAWVSSMSFYFFFFASRMTKPNPAVAPPKMRVAMVVTKAPSEPWPVLQRTLEAMLDQQFPYDYDVWLSDERPDEETLRWCLAHNVKVSTRFGVAEYHQTSWPRRTKCKEGNLAYFYDCVGYANYDVVAQLDADHVPARGYLADMVRPFRDPKVGYVSAPSICDANSDAGWTVRGRLHREATLHGPVQAGSNQGFGPVCIGSHYAVRTQALKEVGGLGPELAEDFTTTLWLQSGGWDGVFNIDAEAHGDGPESLAEMLTQEVQWARSLGAVLTRYAPDKLRTVPLKARIRLGFAVLFYPLQGVALALAAVLPTVGVIFGLSWGNTSLLGFYAHLWPMSLAGLATTAYLRRQKVLRPRNAKLWSWELLLFQMVRWPWAMYGAFQGMWIGYRREDRTFKVTPKGVSGLKPLPLNFVLPSLLIGAIPAWVALTTMTWGRASGLMLLACGQAVTYLAVVLIAAAVHASANGQAVMRASGAPLHWQGAVGVMSERSVIVSALIVLPTVAALIFKLSQII